MPNSKPVRQRTRRAFGSLIPHTLRGRFIATTVAVALAVAASTITIGAALDARILRMQAASTAQGLLAEFNDYVRFISVRTGARASDFAARPDVAAGLRSRDTSSLAFLLGVAFPPSDGRTVVLLDRRGTVVASAGPDAFLFTDAATLPDGARRVSKNGAAASAVIVSRSVPASGTQLGTIVYATPLAAETRHGFQTAAGDPLLMERPGTAKRIDGWPSFDMAGFVDARYSSNGPRTQALATYLGTDGRPVVDVGVDRTDPSLVQIASASRRSGRPSASTSTTLPPGPARRS